MSKSLKTAHNNGKAAFEAGEPKAACPYKDKRKKDGRLTWSRAYRNAWLEGWELGESIFKESLMIQRGHQAPFQR